MKKKIFPPAYTRGGARMEHIPSQEEMEHCEYAEKANVVCPRKQGQKRFVAGGEGLLIKCAWCPYHPAYTPYR